MIGQWSKDGWKRTKVKMDDGASGKDGWLCIRVRMDVLALNFFFQAFQGGGFKLGGENTPSVAVGRAVLIFRSQTTTIDCFVLPSIRTAAPWAPIAPRYHYLRPLIFCKLFKEKFIGIDTDLQLKYVCFLQVVPRYLLISQEHLYLKCGRLVLLCCIANSRRKLSAQVT